MTLVFDALRLAWRLLFAAIVVVAVLLVGLRWAASSRETQDLGSLPAQGGRLIATSEAAIYVLERGNADGTTVLFAHGTAAWSGLWLPTLEAVGALGYRTIGYDLPPFGFSEHAADGDYSRQRQADRVLALVEALDTRPIVVAHSFGAGSVAEAVLRKPEAFAGLVLVAGAIGLNSHLDPKQLPGILRNDQLRGLVVSATATNPYLTGKFLRDLIYVKSAADAQTIAVLHQPMQRSGYTSAVTDWVPSLLETPTNALSTQPQNWQGLTLPIVLIWGDMDTVTPLDQAKALAANTTTTSLIILDGVGHIPQIEAPQAFQARLIAALEAIAE